MKYLLAISLLAIITALSINPTIEDKVDQQLEVSEKLHDSAVVLLEEISQKNDSLLVEHFGK